MLQYIKDMGRALLYSLESCPAGKIKPSNELLPILEFTNGLYHPMAATEPPNVVYFEYQGDRWRLQKGQKAWHRV